MRKTFEQIREQLGNGLRPQDNNYGYRARFVGTGKSGFSTAPNVEVRVELRPHEGRYRFEVMVYFHLPSGVTPDNAAEYVGLATAAVQTAQWAQNIVEGREWTLDEVV